MVIEDVRIREVRHPNGKLRAVASVTIDGCFVVHDIRIFDRDGELMVAMPSRKTSEGGFKDVAHPLNSETREYMQSTILSAYREFMSKKEEGES